MGSSIHVGLLGIVTPLSHSTAVIHLLLGKREVHNCSHVSKLLLSPQLTTLHNNKQDTVGHLKSRLEGVTGLAVNKQKLHRDGVGFLRDELSLAHYNISPDVTLVLGTKTRGGKK